MQHISYQAGGYDWLATWRRMYDDEREQAERVTPPEFAVQADFWASQAGRVAAIARQSPPDLILLSLGLPSEDVFALSEELGRSKTLARVPVFVLGGAELHADARERLSARLDRLVLHESGALDSLLERTRSLAAAQRPS